MAKSRWLFSSKLVRTISYPKNKDKCEQSAAGMLKPNEIKPHLFFKIK